MIISDATMIASNWGYKVISIPASIRVIPGNIILHSCVEQHMSENMGTFLPFFNHHKQAVS